MRRWLVTALGVLAACGPIPGGSLSGQLAEAPASWTESLGGDHAICEIESRPADPHSIQLDCFLYQGALYVQSHRWALASWWPVQSWAAIWQEHPEVRVRIADSIYPLRAVLVNAEHGRESVLIFRGYDPVPDGIVVFRFEPRS